MAPTGITLAGISLRGGASDEVLLEAVKKDKEECRQMRALLDPPAARP
jgi:hypothetical protein